MVEEAGGLERPRLVVAVGDVEAEAVVEIWILCRDDEMIIGVSTQAGQTKHVRLLTRRARTRWV